MIKNEITRQTLHVLIGTALLLLYAQGLINWLGLFLLIAGGLMLLLIISTGMFTKLQKIIELDKRADKYLPGYGALSLTGGFLLTILIFEQRTAIPALIILTYGDSAATIIGSRYGKTRIRWNQKKSAQGTIGAIIASAAITSPLIGLPAAIIASATTLLFETIPLPKWLDDNLLLPLVAGIVLTIII